jgi:hypothetical protein
MCRPSGVGADLLPASTVIPAERTERDVDRELVDLLCADAQWVEETFRDIVAASWDEPPRGGAAPLSARPRRFGSPSRRGRRRGAAAGSQWRPAPHSRQRSPPVAPEPVASRAQKTSTAPTAVGRSPSASQGVNGLR